MQLDSIQIGVADLADAARDYALVLGREPTAPCAHTRRFELCRGAVELEPGELGVHSLRFVPEPGEAPRWPLDREAFNGLDVRVGGVATATTSVHSSPGVVHAIDHVVINTPDLDRAVALWRDRLGIRLALDREFPHRGLRMCFFRSAGITLEFVGSLPPPREREAPDRLYGLAYQVTDLANCRARLLRAGVDVSETRPGNKTDTTVATVRSHTAGVPTLLIAEVAG
ncbi:MAG TPA: VOC family protein [Candidatus Kryptonia bacterium]|nr:VOC family protein [Candidatus Kryptonia bacterium]